MMMDSASGGQELTLFHAEGVLVTSRKLVTGRRTWLISEVEGVNTLYRTPRVLPLLATLVLGALVGLPLLVSGRVSSSWLTGELHGVAMAVAAVAIFGSIAGLLMAEDSYWVVLRTRQRERRVFRSTDYQLVNRLVAAIESAVEVARKCH
jgi:hypothetical protein